MISYRALVRGKEYGVISPDGIYKRMKFHEYEASYRPTLAEKYAINTYGLFTPSDNDKHAYYFGGRDVFQYYDREKVRENAKRAREQMEIRTVNMILKRLVNEEFEWR
uniref:Uncharacterized protein n=1 Tax=viral metagenome TaxID=1070528 RepID=A0A6C0D1R0_9ZZZZ